jgi:hypothetical protein
VVDELHGRLVDQLGARCEFAGYDYAVRVATEMECEWSCEVRVTLEPNRPDRPDRSLVTYAVAGQVAEAVARAVMEMLEWLNERS